MAYFPMFIDIKDKKCLVVGGGRVAYRKVKFLLDFDGNVFVVAPKIIDELISLDRTNDNITIFRRGFDISDIDGCILVIAASSDIELNSRISKLCNEKNIPVNVVDTKDECSFILPAYIKEQNVVAAFSSSGNSPVITQYLKEKEQDILLPFIGEINEYLGQYRNLIKNMFDNEQDRKRAYKYLLKYALDNDSIPDEDMTLYLIDELKQSI